MSKLKSESLQMKKPKTIPREILEVDYFHEVSNIIFRLVEFKSKVLDVGCGTGRLGEKLKLEKKCYVVGVENDEEKAKLARNRLNRLIIVDIEKINILPFPQNYFDTLVFADVLEHLRNPEMVLKNLKQYLHDNGHIIVSIPNVANWTLRLKLLFGKWNYKERGLLDKTHSKYYTLRTAKRLIQETGYKVVFLTCTSGWSRLDWNMPLKNPVNMWKSLLGCNFIFKAQRYSLESEL